MLQSNHLLPHLSLPLPQPSLHLLHLRSSSLHFLRRLQPSSSFKATAASPQSRLAELTPEVPSSPQPKGEGPVEISPLTPSPLFAVTDNPTPLQVSTSVLLTGAISVFLFRSLRRRARRAKDLVHHFNQYLFIFHFQALVLYIFFSFFFFVYNV